MTPDERRAALVERVEAECRMRARNGERVNVISVTLSLALEEAAQIVDGLDNCDCHDCQVRKEKAAAIRALIPGK